VPSPPVGGGAYDAPVCGVLRWGGVNEVVNEVVVAALVAGAR